MDIKIPGYSINNMSDYFTIRYVDKAPYYAVSDRIDLSLHPLLNFKETLRATDFNDKDLEETSHTSFKNTLFRGDCYIC